MNEMSQILMGEIFTDYKVQIVENKIKGNPNHYSTENLES